MLGTLLDRLGGLFSKYFLIGAFFPVLLAAGANGFLLYAASSRVRAIVTQVEGLTEGRQGIVVFAALIGLAAGAYLFSAASPLLRELLEGRHWPRALHTPFERSERARRRHAESLVESARRGRRELKCSASRWPDRLADARKLGRGKGAPTSADLDGAQTRLRGLWSLVEGSGLVPAASLASLVTDIEALLTRFDADVSAELDALQDRTVAVVREAETAWDLEYLRRFTERRADFGDGRVAPTRLGNIAETVQSYAVGRYRLNADAVWGSLEKVIVKDTEFHGLLQDARTELNFFVSLWWLTALSAAAWWPVTALRLSWLAFVIAATAGPGLAAFWYLLAQKSYRNLAVRLTSAIDLYRFDLLAALHVPLPEGLRTERDAWDRLNKLASFGEDVDLAYQHKTS
jgi:hypothetical protein